MAALQPPALAEATPYASSREHLLAELARTDALVQRHARKLREASKPDVPAAPDAGPSLESLTHDLDARHLASVRAKVPLRLDLLAARFGLSRFDVDVLLIALLPELDMGYERLFGSLQHETTRQSASVEMTLLILCASLSERLAALERMGARSPLQRHSLIHVFSARPELQPPLNSCHFRVDERVVDYLLHDADDLDRRLVPLAQVIEPARTRLDPDGLAARLVAWIKAERAPGKLVYLQGPAGVGEREIAAGVCGKLKKPLVTVNVRTLVSAPAERRSAFPALVLREARLTDAVILWEGFDALLGDELTHERTMLLHALREADGLSFLSGEAAWEPSGGGAAWPFLSVQLAHPSAGEQLALWQRALAGARLADDVDLEQLVNGRRLSGERIRDAAATARSLARFRDPTAPQIGAADLLEAGRRHAQPRLGALARKIVTNKSWNDLVLAPDRLLRLREICNQARHRRLVLETWGFADKLSTGKGLSLLFSGAPGTGKTLTASVLANELGLELHQIELSSVVSKYIGETEKLLSRIFDEAETSRAVLFFDEADALFGKRTEVRDAHDRYANIETSYLLQRMDSFQGIVILASNLSRNMDEAFVRRLQFVVDFGLPDERERLLIWQRVWPQAAPRDASVDLPLLARRFELAGGHIRNIALAAAFLAATDGSPVTQKHIFHATRRELQKTGKILDEASFR